MSHALTNSIRPTPPSESSAPNLRPGLFVISVVDGYVVETKEVSVRRDHLAGELDGGLLAVADAEEYAEKLGVGERGRPGLQQTLARPELGR